jgi:hypothetical protein
VDFPLPQKKEQQKADNADAAAGKKKKVTAAQLRIQKGETSIVPTRDSPGEERQERDRH